MGSCLKSLTKEAMQEADFEARKNDAAFSAIVKKKDIEPAAFDKLGRPIRRTGRSSSFLDARKLKFLEYFFDQGNKDTYGCISHSAKAAGFGLSYATQLSSTRPKWFMDHVILNRHGRRLLKIEDNIDDLLGSSDERVKADMTKFCAKTLMKEQYSEEKAPGTVNNELRVVHLPIEIINNYGGNKTDSGSGGDSGRPAQIQGC